MKDKIHNTGRLEIAIVIALLVLAAVIIIAVKMNRIILPEKDPLVQKAEKREIVSIKKSSVTISKINSTPVNPAPARRSWVNKRRVKFPEEEKVLTQYEEERLTEKRARFTEKIRQKQMGQLRKDLKKLEIEENKKNIPKEEILADTSRYDIYPDEEDIKKMETEKVLLY